MLELPLTSREAQARARHIVLRPRWYQDDAGHGVSRLKGLE